MPPPGGPRSETSEDTPDTSSLFGQSAANDRTPQVRQVNWLIDVLGLAETIEYIERIDQCSSSFFTLLCLHALQKRLPRADPTLSEYERKLYNVRVTITSLSEAVLAPLDHISAEAIVNNDILHISRLLRVFLNLVKYYDIGDPNHAPMPASDDQQGATTAQDGDDALEDVTEDDGGAAGLDDDAAEEGQRRSMYGDLDDPFDAAGPRAEFVPAVSGEGKRERVTKWVRNIVQPPHDEPTGPHLAYDASRPLTDAEVRMIRERLHRLSLAADSLTAHQRRAPAVTADATSDTRRRPAAAATADGTATPSAAPRPFAAASAVKILRSAPGVRSLNAAIRDAKIEHIRTYKYLQAIEGERAKQAIRRASETEAAVRHRAREQLRQYLRDVQDEKRSVRDHDDMLRGVCWDIIMSKASAGTAFPDAGLNGLPSTDRGGGCPSRSAIEDIERRRRCLHRQQQALAAAAAEAAAMQRSQKEALRNDLARFDDVVTSWRETPLAKGTLSPRYRRGTSVPSRSARAAHDATGR